MFSKLCFNYLDLPPKEQFKIYYSRHKRRIFIGIGVGCLLFAGVVCVILIYRDLLTRQEEGISDDLSIPHDGKSAPPQTPLSPSSKFYGFWLENPYF